MSLKTSIGIIFVLVFSHVYAMRLVQPTDRDLDGLVGLVKRIEEEVADVKMKGGNLKEGSLGGVFARLRMIGGGA